ncbi:hypothetical protein GCM10017781_33560 [Deinococcus metalli]|uniref:Transposase n=1 Tax=Deinococcus metalli TaxID=1141878 RepID=A0ABQ3JUD4_9DEIO|nr:hypothetical protein GCM10017781_33560 [Deinococcus metalli]
MRSGQKRPSYRFPVAVISDAVWLDHRFTPSYRNIEDLLLERRMCGRRASIRTECI